MTATNGLLKMSELAERSGVSAGTIKHYLREGLLPEPVRTSRNMAYYPEQFVERIRLIKRLQEERFMPLRLIREHPDRGWTVPTMAAAVSLSRSAFAERFRAATGETPMQNLTRYRMARAAEYLRATRAGIREIARLTGYDSEVSVTKAFRRQYGTTPGAYRRSRAVAPSAVGAETTAAVVS